tara:strand:+ start:1358 stop:2206 length:849 start_codon:yes stop_codon:yes gene_type:complete
MQTKEKRSTGRPKIQNEAVAEAPVMEAPIKASTKKKRSIKRKETVSTISEYEIIKGGGIVFMLPQKGVTIYDKENDTVREIRYCPNEPSIFVDEQSENALRESVIFNNSRLFIPKEKPNLKKFLELHPSNTLNGGSLFKVVNKTKDASEELEKEFLVSDAISIVRDRDINDLLAIAMYYGININADTTEIRYNLLRIAKSKPKDFLQSLDSPEVTCRSSVKQAGDYQIIALKSNGVYWFDSNALIISVPVGQDPIDTMVRFCLTEKGASTFSLIEEKLDKLS